MQSRHRYWFPMLLPVAASIPGCAHLDYVKVPSPSQYDRWNDDLQREADAMEGVRYYLPRPFVHLKRSVPIAQRVAFVSFVRGDKGYELRLPDDAPTWVRRVAPTQISVTQALAATLAPAEVAPGKQQAGGVGTTPPESPAGEGPPSELKSRNGFINESDPVTALSDLMDVVYLPDMEEQYVIQPHGGLGTVDIETRLRNGWAAEVFSQQVDNSNLIPYVIRQVERTSEAAAGIATTWLPVAAGLPPGASLGSVMAAAKQQAGAVGEERQLENVLLFKIAEVRMAQPGIYPILKPREISQWLRLDTIASGADPQATFELFLEQANVPWIRPDMAFIPCPPFTVVGFNATTDVYLTSATARLTTAPAGESSQTRPATEATEAAEQRIEKLLTDAKPNVPNGDGDRVADIVVEADGDKTRITLQSSALNTKFESTGDKFKTWANDALSLTGEDRDKTEATASGSTVTIVMDVPISDLGQR